MSAMDFVAGRLRTSRPHMRPLSEVLKVVVMVFQDGR